MARYKYSLFQTFIISSHILLFLNFYYFFARKGSFIVIASYLVLSTLVIMQINIKKKFIFNIGSLFILFWSYPTLAFVFMLLHFVLLPYSIVTSLYVLIFLIVAAFLFNYIDSSTLQIHLITYTPASIQPIDFTNFIGKAYVVISQYSNIQFFSSILSTILIVIIGGILIHNKLVLFKYLIVSFYFFTSLLDGYSNLFSRLAFFMSIPIMSNFNFSSTFYSNLLALNHERLAIMRKTLIFLLLLIFFNIVSMYFLYT